MPSVLSRCWLGDRKGFQPVKKLNGGVLAWLSAWSKVQMAQLIYHCHSVSLAPVNPDWCCLSGTSSPRWSGQMAVTRVSSKKV